MLKMVVDIYRLTDEQMKEYDLYYRYRIAFYNYKFKILETSGFTEEQANEYYIGQMIEY